MFDKILNSVNYFRKELENDLIDWLPIVDVFNYKKIIFI